jgi:pilus assembly protein Flp/PilA
MIKSTISSVRRFLRQEQGATMVEYALLVALIALVVIGAVSLLGTSSSSKLSEAASSLSGS